MNSVKRFSRVLNLSVFLGGLLMFILGFLVIFGWYTNNPTLIQVYPKFVPMQYNTALGFLIFGVVLIFQRIIKENVLKGFNVFLILLGGLTLIQYIFKLNFGIDELMMNHYITVETSHPGRMAPNTAINFFLSGLSLFIISTGKTRKKVFFASCIGATVLGLGIVAFLGYLSNVQSAHGWGKYTHMAIHTATGFMVGGISIILFTIFISIKERLKISYLSLSFSIGVAGVTLTLAIWQALGASKVFSGGMPNDLLIWIRTSILLLGGGLSLTLTIALWIAYRFWQELIQLKRAKKKILLLNHKLKEQSNLDPLTGIPNRRAWNKRIKEEVSKACIEKYSIAISLFDIDYFKKYNDYYGHQQGDKCLVEFARSLQHQTDWHKDFVARYGGEEFVAIFTKVKIEEIEKILQRIKNTFKGYKIPHASSSVSDYITFSAGICVGIPNSIEDIENYILYADDALYNAKTNGRDRFEIYNYESI
ncbi:MAG: GGDEF domain-containing protein [Leptospiraceae bacterium]|nr:GGDEF domain-containing protein [Leptospiraceae bacterium]